MKKVEVLENGPVLLHMISGNIALCRCGKSQNRPYCDGMHTKNGFKAMGVTVWPVSTNTEKASEA